MEGGGLHSQAKLKEKQPQQRKSNFVSRPIEPGTVWETEHSHIEVIDYGESQLTSTEQLLADYKEYCDGLVP